MTIHQLGYVVEIKQSDDQRQDDALLQRLMNTRQQCNAVQHGSSHCGKQ